MKILSKELFVETLKAIKTGYERRNKFESAITEFNDAYFICNIGDEWLNQLVLLLEQLMNDENNPKYGTTISWWLWEDVDKKIWWEVDGQKFEKDLTTPEALYDYLVEKAG